MKEFRLLGIILCVLQSLDFVDCDCTLPFGTGTYISSTRGTWTTTNTTIGNYKFTIGSLTTTIPFTCYSLYDTDRYILTSHFEIFNNLFIDLYTCLDIKYSTYPDKYYFYEATEFDTNSGDHFTEDNTSVCNRANYLTAYETKVVIKQGTYDTNKIYCPDIILGNYTYNSSGDYSDMDSCNDKQQLTFKKNIATYVALSSGGNLKCMYSGISTYIYLITFNIDASVDSSNTYQFTCFALSFSGYGSMVFASQRPRSCSSSQTPSNPDSTAGKIFIFVPHVTCPITTTTSTSTTTSTTTTASTTITTTMGTTTTTTMMTTTTPGITTYGTTSNTGNGPAITTYGTTSSTGNGPAITIYGSTSSAGNGPAITTYGPTSSAGNGPAITTYGTTNSTGNGPAITTYGTTNSTGNGPAITTYGTTNSIGNGPAITTYGTTNSTAAGGESGVNESVIVAAVGGGLLGSAVLSAGIVLVYYLKSKKTEVSPL